MTDKGTRVGDDVASLNTVLRAKHARAWAGLLVMTPTGEWEERSSLPPKGTRFVEVFRSGETREYLNDGTCAYRRITG